MKNYLGVKTVKMNDEQLERFYCNPSINSLQCGLNQYVVIQTSDENLIGPYYWNGEEFVEVRYQVFESRMFGAVKPKNKDPYQMAYMDSLTRNQLTFATGPAGSGKSLLALAYAFQEYEKGRVSKIIVFANPYIADSAVKLGFMPGTKTEKLLETSIGSILISKIGDRILVEDMIAKGQLVLMPMGDCRGYEVPPDAFVYFTEAQNTNIYLMKLFLQRTNDECKICVEGDERQVDSDKFHNGLNGLARAIEVFAGEDYSGHVELQTIYRGRIAQKAEAM